MRTVTYKRKTGETDIKVKLNLDGSGRHKINTSIPFMDHMLTQLAVHGMMDIDINAVGDTEIDFHHTIEDIGITLGEAFKQAISDKKGIVRYGNATIPLNEALSSVALDISGRPFLKFNVGLKKEKVGEFDTELVEEFFHAFTNHAMITLHINLLYGTNIHHIIETIFKAFARALKDAVSIDIKNKNIPSTKGTL